MALAPRSAAGHLHRDLGHRRARVEQDHLAGRISRAAAAPIRAFSSRRSRSLVANAPPVSLRGVADGPAVHAPQPPRSLEDDQVPPDRGVRDAEADREVGDADALVLLDEPRDLLASLLRGHAARIGSDVDGQAHLLTPIVRPWIEVPLEDQVDDDRRQGADQRARHEHRHVDHAAVLEHREADRDRAHVRLWRNRSPTSRSSQIWMNWRTATVVIAGTDSGSMTLRKICQ